jgi:hypothetical protein
MMPLGAYAWMPSVCRCRLRPILDGNPVNVTLMYRNLLVGDEPGSGKLSLLNTIIAHCPFCPDALVLIDGKVVEFGLWREAAQVQVRAHFRGCPVTHPAPPRRPGRRRAA